MLLADISAHYLLYKEYLERGGRAQDEGARGCAGKSGTRQLPLLSLKGELVQMRQDAVPEAVLLLLEVGQSNSHYSGSTPSIGPP